MPTFLGVLFAALITTSNPRTLTSVPVIANDNRVAAGVLRGGVLELHLEVRMGAWRPEAGYGPVLEVPVFSEEGKAAQNPGPLIRVPEGTVIHATIHNIFATPLVIHGLLKRPASTDDVLRIEPGATAEVRFEAGVPGTYFYWATIHDLAYADRRYDDAQLNGAFVIDPASSAVPPDRVFLISLWSGLGSDGKRAGVFTVNGLSWPHTERLTYDVGDSVHWRVINATIAMHPMHLHGFYYQVEARGTVNTDTLYSSRHRRMVVTELLAPATTMNMSWSPDRSGNWPFHCHLIAHITPAQRLGRPLLEGAEAIRQHAVIDMAGLMLATYVRPPAGEAKAGAPSEAIHMRLLARPVPGKYGKYPGLSWVLQAGETEPAADSLPIPGSAILLTRGQPYHITVVNHGDQMISTHWHGMELESYYDGVAGLSGNAQHLAPMVSPGDSFVVEFTPRRAGTFIYHTHMDEAGQLGSGLYGPLIVLEPGEQLSPYDRIVLLGQGGPVEAEAQVEANGRTPPDPIEMRAGSTYHLRLINITPSFTINVAVVDGNGKSVTWRAIAKDGAVLPPALQNVLPAEQVFGPGETYDFDVTPQTPGYLRLQINARHAGNVRNFFVPVRVTR